jgi:pimeloyl-ACP methyl ester carboxylesterase
MDTQTYSEIAPTGFVLRRIETTVGHIAVWDRAGHAPALVLIHGNSASKAAFRKLLRQPALQGRRVVALDLPGAGESDDAHNPEEDYTFTAMAQTICAALRDLDALDAVVLGWSLGGHLAIEAVGQGAPFRAMILTGTPPCGPGAEEVAEVFYPGELMAVVTGETPSPEMLNAYIKVLYGNTAPIYFEMFDAGRRFDGRMRRVFSQNLMSTAEPRPKPQRKVVAEWKGPIAVIQGDQEPFFNPRGLDTLKWRNLWRGQSQWVAGTGHAPFFEQPEIYGALVGEFLADIGA